MKDKEKEDEVEKKEEEGGEGGEGGKDKVVERDQSRGKIQAYCNNCYL